MVKIVSLILFVTAFVWTWFLFNSESKIGQATHAGIQSKLMTFIEESVKSARPGSSQFKILNIYTQALDDNQISAHFTYKYVEQLENQEQASQTMTGEALLYRGLSENPKEDKWIAKSIKTSNSSIEFQQGLVITPDSASSSEAIETSPAAIPAQTESKKTH